MLQFFASEGHFRRHWEPVRAAVGGEWISREQLQRPGQEDRPLVVASYGDLRRAYEFRHRIIMAEHGTGLTYDVNHPSHAGSTALRDHVVLRLLPNRFAAAKEHEANPDMPIAVVGVPYLDQWRGRQYRSGGRPLVVISTHWDCAVCPETRSSFEHFKAAIALLARGGLPYELALHAHPRIRTEVTIFARAHRIRFLPEFTQVLELADLYATDNSSTLFEFAATGRPVLVLNAPSYRPDISHAHNPRFWECADVGVNVWEPAQLDGAIMTALMDEPRQRERRKAVSAQVVPFMGSSIQRCVEALQPYL